MNRKSLLTNSSWACFTIILLLSLVSRSVPAIFAQADDDTIRRDEMVEIAECYASHSWDATTDNVLHEERFYAGYWWQVDTPDGQTPEGVTNGGWWATDAENVGIPYQWGGWSALTNTVECPDVNLAEDNDGSYFAEQLQAGYAAGDNYTESQWDGERWIPKYEYPQGSGIDCSGLVSRAWRTGSKYGSRGLRSATRPIQFKDLRAGDLLHMPGHVMLFKAFTTAEKETPGTTRISVIEASGYDWKVSEREYLLTNLRQRTETWRGGEYTTHQVTLERVADGQRFIQYSPRTYLNPIDAMLLIDRSGSMSSEGKMEAAKNAAKMFVDLMRTGDKIGVVDFDDIVSLTYPLTEIDSEGTTKTEAKNAIDTLYASGATAIGGALQLGQEELNTPMEIDPVRVEILLSDGVENRAPYVSDVLPSIIDDEIMVHTVGLGSDADQDLLQSIADQTDGEYRFSPSGSGLQEIYNAISARVYGEEVVRTASGLVRPEETVVEQALVDSSMGQVTFMLSWLGSDLDLSVVQPDGTVIDSSTAQADSNVSFTSGDTYEFYRISGPQSGEWKLEVFGKSVPIGGEAYTVSVTARDSMVFTVTSDKPKYYLNEPIKITARIEDSFLDVTEPQYVVGAHMQMDVKDPNQNTYSLELYDDGFHGDGEASDGTYANAFVHTSYVGSYDFDIEVSGVNNRHGQSFTRQYGFSALVSDDPPQLSTIAVSADPARIPADGTSTSIITAEARDQYYNPFMDRTVITFTASLGTITPITDTTDQGIANSVLASGSVTGTATVTATAGPVAGTVDVAVTVPKVYLPLVLRAG